jgi:hypothetical protein
MIFPLPSPIHLKQSAMLKIVTFSNGLSWIAMSYLGIKQGLPVTLLLILSKTWSLLTSNNNG